MFVCLVFVFFFYLLSCKKCINAWTHVMYMRNDIARQYRIRIMTYELIQRRGKKCAVCKRFRSQNINIYSKPVKFLKNAINQQVHHSQESCQLSEVKRLHRSSGGKSVTRSIYQTGSYRFHFSLSLRTYPQNNREKLLRIRVRFIFARHTLGNPILAKSSANFARGQNSSTWLAREFSLTLDKTR